MAASKFQQSRRVEAKDQQALVFRYVNETFYHVDGMGVAHVGRTVAAHHDAIGTDLFNKVGEDVAVVGNGVVMEAAQIRRRRLFHVCEFLAHFRPVIPAADQCGQSPAGMG